MRGLARVRDCSNLLHRRPRAIHPVLPGAHTAHLTGTPPSLFIHPPAPQQALQLVGKLAKAMGRAIAREARCVVGPAFKCLTDNKATVRAARGGALAVCKGGGASGRARQALACGMQVQSVR